MESGPTGWTPAEERAYVADRLGRERLANIAASLGALALTLGWAAFDWYLEPRWFAPFLVLRLTNTAAQVVLLAALVRTRDLACARAYGALAMIVPAALIAPMLPRVEHYGLYALGFSLPFWAPAVIELWPVRVAALSYGCNALALLGAHLLYRDGWRPRELAAATAYVGAGSAFGVVVAYLRRRMERRAFRLGYELEVKTAELASSLGALEEAQARAVAAEKLAASGRLLAGLSHELNNPVNVVHNNAAPLAGYAADAERFLEIARARAADVAQGLEEVARRVREGTAALERSTAQVRHLHGELRTLIRGDALEAVVAASPGDGLSAAVAMVRRSLCPGVEVELDCGELPAIEHRPGQLNGAFLNLVLHAVTSVGAHGKVVVRGEADRAAVRITVADSGPALGAEALARLFEPFAEARGAASTGLGLATARHVIAGLGGRVEAHRDEVLGGVAVVVALPLRSAA